MKFEFASLSLREYSFGHAHEYVEMFLYSVIVFSLPFILGHEQLLVGATVNCALVLAALNLRGKSLLPVILLPSIGVIAAGAVFGSLSSALVYMVPFIWIGNAILVLSVKEIVIGRRNNRVAALLFGAGAKSLFLFAAAFALFSLNVLPAAFLTAMGVFQLITAVIGGTAAMGIQEVKRRI